MDYDGMELAPSLARLYGTPDPPGVTLRKLKGDASSRAYYRLSVPNPGPAAPGSIIVMRLPEQAFGSDEAAGADPPPEELPFLNVRRLLAGRGLPVPAVFIEDLPRRLLLLEDLGDETFERRLHDRGPSAWPALYATAVDLLAEVHERCEAPAPDSLAHRRRFDRSLLRWELDHFREWGLEALHGPLPPAERAELESLFDQVAEAVAAQPEGFVHRDYQSRNLMWRAEGDLVIIDFQDALIGPRIYDLVALLCDSYVPVGPELQRAMVARYAERRGLATGALETELGRQAVQRKLKDAGRFVFIDRVRGDPSFLPWYGPSLAYVGRALDRLSTREPRGPWAALRALLERHVPGFSTDVP
ncbi:MAG: aminoglycoside phosphotransferase family protein, partial [Myxococcota bacterium]